MRVALSRLSGSALGTESVEREKHRRTFEGFTATPTGVVADAPACLSTTRFPCRADPTNGRGAARYPRFPRPSPSSFPSLSTPRD